FLVHAPDQQAGASKGIVHVQLIHPPHQDQIARRHRPWQIVHAAPADVQNLGLLGHRQAVLAVNHLLALRMPALMSAPSKKSFSSVSSPILACSAFTSGAGAPASRARPSNTL